MPPIRSGSIYLPQTMSPCETSREAGLLEHPAEAFAYFRSQGVPQVVCEEKHMGSRAVVIVCRDAGAARKRFGVTSRRRGIIYTRTGRRFFNTRTSTRTRPGDARRSSAAGFWDEFQTTWACLDCELMPWSAKAQELLRSQYAAVGAAGNAALPQVVASLSQAEQRLNGDARQQIEQVTRKFAARREHVERFVRAYRHYCWPVESLDDLKLAPFHLLASEGMVHVHQNHVWHMETLAKICRHDPQVLLATAFQVVDVTVPGERTGGNRMVECSYRSRGRRDGREAARVRRAGQEGVWCNPRSNAADRNISDHLRPRLHGRRTFAATAKPEPGGQTVVGRSRIRAWGLKLWNVSCGTNRCGECTSACLAFWRWRASRSIPGCKALRELNFGSSFGECVHHDGRGLPHCGHLELSANPRRAGMKDESDSPASPALD